MNYNEMSAAHCADWLEAKDEWIRTTVDGYATWTRKCPPEVAASPHNFRRTPPYPLTLDAAAGALREPWRLRSVAYCDDRKAWQAIIERVDKSDTLWTWYAPDRLTAEYRAAVASRMEEDK